MATFSFGKFFGKGPRQPRFKAGLEAPGDGDESGAEVLPVGRLVSFTDHGPEDAPLFQEVEGEGHSVSPFVVVDGGRPAGGGLPGAVRSAGGEEGFTAEELIAMVPAQCVRVGAVPSNQVISLPPGVLRASLAAGQPAVLLSQLHQACPALFVAPGSLDEDLVVTLPPQKVQRLVSRAAATGSAAPGNSVARPSLLGHGDFDVTGLGVSVPVPPRGGPPFAMEPAKVKLPPPRRKFDELQGTDLRPMVEKQEPLATPAVPFTELGSAVPNGIPLPAGANVSAGPAFEASPLPSAFPSSPFQVASSLPHRSSGRGDAFPKRYASPFSIVSPGEVPSVLESPFARQPVVGHTPTPPPSPPTVPTATALDPVPRETPEPPATVSLRLSALLQGQHPGTVGFDPDRVPPHVRVTLAADPLLAQVPNGRIKVSVAEVTAGLEPKYQPAFGKADPSLELQVPMRELFDNLPQATPPTPPAPPVASTFETPFSLRASEDAPLTALNSPFKIVPPSPTAPSLAASPPLPPAPPLPPPSPPSLPSESSMTPATAAVPPPLPSPSSPPLPPSAAAVPPEVTFDSFGSASPTEEPASPFVVIPPHALESTAPAPPPPLAPPAQETRPALASPFLLVPDTDVDVPTPASFTPPTKTPAEPIAPPTHNPFSFAPGQTRPSGFGLDLPVLPFDEDPVPLESLREDPVDYAAPAPPPEAPLGIPEESEDQPKPASFSTPVPPPAVVPPSAPRAPLPIVGLPPFEAPPIVNLPPLETSPVHAVAPIPPILPFSLAVPAPPPSEVAEVPVTPPLPPAGADAPTILTSADPEPESPIGAPDPGAPDPKPAAPPILSDLTLSEAVALPASPIPDSPSSIPPLLPLSMGLASGIPLEPEGVPPSLPPLPIPFVSVPPMESVGAPPASAAITQPEPPSPPPSIPVPRVPRLALSEQEPMPPPPTYVVEAPVSAAIEPISFTSVEAASPPPAATPAPAAPAGASAAPIDAQRAAFASVFAPSALARTSEGKEPVLGDVDALPAISLAKLPPLEVPAQGTPENPLPTEPTGTATAPPTEPPAAAAVSAIEDLNFGYVDNATQLALRAIFSTDRTLGTQEIVDLAASLDGLSACLVHTPHTNLNSAATPHDPEEVRHFRERAAGLFEKTASLVRELDPDAREQNFTLRTGKSVLSFFAVGDVCLAVLHAEPTFRPGVREKLTLVTRSVADMLSA